MRKKLVAVILFCCLSLSQSATGRCATDSDCENGETCYRPGSDSSACISSNSLGSGNPSGGVGFGTTQDFWDLIFDIHENTADNTPECENVENGLQTMLTTDMSDAKCQGMIDALNISAHHLDNEDEDSDGSFDPALLDGFLIVDLINNKAKMNQICSNPCFPPLWAVSTRASAVCYDQTIPTQLNYICSKNDEGNYCVSYADDIAQIFQDLETDGSSGSELFNILRHKCTLIADMGCCFESYLELYSGLRSRVNDMVSAMSSDFASTPQGQQIAAINNIMQALSPSVIESTAHYVCHASTGDACAIPEAITSAIASAAEMYPMSSNYDPNNPDGPDHSDDEDSSGSSKNGNGAVVAVLVVLLLGAVVGGGYCWIRRRTNRRFEGAPMSSKMGGLYDDVDFGDGDKGSYDPVEVDEGMDGIAVGGVAM